MSRPLTPARERHFPFNASRSAFKENANCFQIQKKSYTTDEEISTNRKIIYLKFWITKCLKAIIISAFDTQYKTTKRTHNAHEIKKMLSHPVFFSFLLLFSHPIDDFFFVSSFSWNLKSVCISMILLMWTKKNIELHLYFVYIYTALRKFVCKEMGNHCNVYTLRCAMCIEPIILCYIQCSINESYDLKH